MSQVLAAAISVLVLIGGALLWFKLRPADSSGVVKAAIEDQRTIKVSIDKALEEKNEHERQELDAKVDEIRKAGDTRAALELLAKLRGVH